jgi:3,4-dihydroxy 2-butanone 4-phosphate synthase/GTP cyclohydrolase II
MGTRAKTDPAWSGLDSIDDIVAAVRAGEMVVILDDEDRENEGDLIMAATKVRPEDVNFMARYGRGLICLTLTRQRCEQLRLPLMVSYTDLRKTTNFTVSIEAAEGVTTGISAHDRARTVLAAVAPDARPDDLRQPGHIFPLMAQPGGVLTRAGHTEAGCDLARLAGLEPTALIVEILNDDGAMARRDDLIRFAKRHKLKIGTIADLIEYRLRTEESVEVVGELEVATAFGPFRMVCFEDHVNRAVHIALVRDALELIAENDHGVVVLLRLEETARDLMKAVGSLGGSEEGLSALRDRTMDFRTFGIGAQILRSLGVRRMRVLGAPRHLHALSGFGLEIVEYLSPEDCEREQPNG